MARVDYWFGLKLCRYVGGLCVYLVLGLGLCALCLVLSLGLGAVVTVAVCAKCEFIVAACYMYCLISLAICGEAVAFINSVGVLLICRYKDVLLL